MSIDLALRLIFTTCHNEQISNSTDRNIKFKTAKDGLILFRYLKQQALLKNMTLFSSSWVGRIVNSPDLFNTISKA